MQYTVLVEYFRSEEGLNTLLKDCQSTFDALDELGKQLQGSVLTTPDDWKVALSQATGHYVFLNPIYTVSMAIKENEELRYYIAEKGELESKGEKVVATTLEKSASLKVAQFRQVRNVLEGYTGVAEKIIATTQSQLKRMEIELKNRNTTLNE
jgi:hypothetical protein